MGFWHIQMYLPPGRVDSQIDSIKMLQETQPVIGTGDWEDKQCYNFKNNNGKGLQPNDIIVVREGAKPIALCKVLDREAFKDEALTAKYLNVWFRKVEVLDFIDPKDVFPQPPSSPSMSIIKRKHGASMQASICSACVLVP
ncbi:hypothetical protein BH10BAC2_BH10BAC2_02720 [soil metagenome]